MVPEYKYLGFIIDHNISINDLSSGLEQEDHKDHAFWG